MTMIDFIRKLRQDTKGAAIVEFALIAPVFMMMTFGVLHVGMLLQNYNAIRNLSADVARYAMVQHQTGNELSNTQLRTFAINKAQGAPYLLVGDRVNAVIETPVNQRVLGAQEREITVTYQMEGFLEWAGIDAPFVTYKRPIFTTDD